MRRFAFLTVSGLERQHVTDSPNLSVGPLNADWRLGGWARTTPRAAATLVSSRTGLIVAIGIIAHDISDGLNTILLVTRGARRQKKDFAFLFADAAAPITGGFIVLTSALSAAGLAVFLRLTSSNFSWFTATGNLLPEAHHRFPTFAVTIAMLVGILFIFAAMTLVASL